MLSKFFKAQVAIYGNILGWGIWIFIRMLYRNIHSSYFLQIFLRIDMPIYIHSSFLKYWWEWYMQIVMTLFQYLWAVGMGWDGRGYKCIYCLESLHWGLFVQRHVEAKTHFMFFLCAYFLAIYATCIGFLQRRLFVQRHFEAKTHFMTLCLVQQFSFTTHTAYR